MQSEDAQLRHAYFESISQRVDRNLRVYEEVSRLTGDADADIHFTKSTRNYEASSKTVTNSLTDAQRSPPSRPLSTKMRLNRSYSNRVTNRSLHEDDTVSSSFENHVQTILSSDAAHSTSNATSNRVHPRMHANGLSSQIVHFLDDATQKTALHTEYNTNAIGSDATNPDAKKATANSMLRALDRATQILNTIDTAAKRPSAIMAADQPLRAVETDLLLAKLHEEDPNVNSIRRAMATYEASCNENREDEAFRREGCHVLQRERRKQRMIQRIMNIQANNENKIISILNGAVGHPTLEKPTSDGHCEIDRTWARFVRYRAPDWKHCAPPVDHCIDFRPSVRVTHGHDKDVYGPPTICSNTSASAPTRSRPYSSPNGHIGGGLIPRPVVSHQRVHRANLNFDYFSGTLHGLSCDNPSCRDSEDRSVAEGIPQDVYGGYSNASMLDRVGTALPDLRRAKLRSARCIRRQRMNADSMNPQSSASLNNRIEKFITNDIHGIVLERHATICDTKDDGTMKKFLSSRKEEAAVDLSDNYVDQLAHPDTITDGDPSNEYDLLTETEVEQCTELFKMLQNNTEIALLARAETLEQYEEAFRRFKERLMRPKPIVEKETDFTAVLHALLPQDRMKTFAAYSALSSMDTETYKRDIMQRLVALRRSIQQVQADSGNARMSLHQAAKAILDPLIRIRAVHSKYTDDRVPATLSNLSVNTLRQQFSGKNGPLSRSTMSRVWQADETSLNHKQSHTSGKR